MSIPAGFTDTGKTAQCPSCSGKGYVYSQQSDQSYIAVQCPGCGGSGTVPILVAS